MFKKGTLIGILTFGIFFGAANLIFPPSVGLLSGVEFVPALLGFVLSAVGIAVVTLVVGSLNDKGYFAAITEVLSKRFAVCFLSALFLTIGPLFAIPRTATTAFSIGIQPLISEGSPLPLIIFTVVYFISAFVLSWNRSKILDYVGKILTPIFVAMIVILVVMGILKYAHHVPSTTLTAYQNGLAFSEGFLQGYNTLDALAAVAFSTIVIEAMAQLGFKDQKEYRHTIITVGVVVASILSLLYFGLAYLGNQFPVPADILQSDMNKGVYILVQATQAIFGSLAQFFLAVMVIVTCFTTTVGLIVSVATFFNEHFPRFSYQQYVILFTLIGFGIANLGLNTIIQFSVPVLMFLYPITITLVCLIVANHWRVLNKPCVWVTISLVMFVAGVDIAVTTFSLEGLKSYLYYLPLATHSLAWLTPAFVGVVLAMIFSKNKIN